ncbi:MAG: selenide, water dikinase SelD [bacterium]
MSPARLAGILDKLPRVKSPDLLVDMETMDDAGVLRLSSELALVQTLDFFEPIVHDPKSFGRIVAANSLSDIWAMGGTALTAMNILAYPSKKISIDVIEELLIGACEKLQEANVILVGGHTMEMQEIFYGMSVTGTIHPDRVLTNAKARIGDKLLLTKPLGVAVYCEALRNDGLTGEQYNEVIGSMERLNLYASQVLQRFDISAMTDVTGFGLLGHALPIARNAGVTLAIAVHDIPHLSSFFDLMQQFLPTQTWKSHEYVKPFTWRDEHISTDQYALLGEAQTSGGLLAAINPKQANEALSALHAAGDTAATVIGEVVGLVNTSEGHPVFLQILP